MANRVLVRPPMTNYSLTAELQIYSAILAYVGLRHYFDDWGRMETGAKNLYLCHESVQIFYSER